MTAWLYFYVQKCLYGYYFTFQIAGRGHHRRCSDKNRHSWELHRLHSRLVHQWRQAAYTASFLRMGVSLRARLSFQRVRLVDKLRRLRRRYGIHVAGQPSQPPGMGSHGRTRGGNWRAGGDLHLLQHHLLHDIHLGLPGVQEGAPLLCREGYDWILVRVHSHHGLAVCV